MGYDIPKAPYDISKVPRWHYVLECNAYGKTGFFHVHSKLFMMHMSNASVFESEEEALSAVDIALTSGATDAKPVKVTVHVSPFHW